MSITEHHKIVKTSIFKTRIEPCRIVVRADHENCAQLPENRQQFFSPGTSFVDGQSEVRTINRDLVRFPEHC
jgi:hypothetical protein